MRWPQYIKNAYSRAESFSHWERFLKTPALLSNLIPPCFYYLTNLVSVSYAPAFLMPRHTVGRTFLHQEKKLITPKLKKLREFRPKFCLGLVHAQICACTCTNRHAHYSHTNWNSRSLEREREREVGNPLTYYLPTRPPKSKVILEYVGNRPS